MAQENIVLPKWLKSRYKILWDIKGNNTFTADEAKEMLGKDKVKKEEVLVVLSELRKANWIEAAIDPDDARKRIYKLKNEEEIYLKELSFKENEISKDEIIRILKRAADLIRTRVDYKFILVLLFLKQISDKWDYEYDVAYKEAIKDGFSEKEADEEAQDSIYHDFNFSKELTWENIRKDVDQLPEKFSAALKAIAEENNNLKNVIDSFDFIEFAGSRENSEILRQLVELFSKTNLNKVGYDILGDAYEWILGYFAPQNAKEGEIYTPREVIELLVEILDPKPEERVYDPASASNGMLIISHKYVEANHGPEEVEKLFLYGQEQNSKTRSLGAMNLYIHNIKNANVELGDTLRFPKFKDDDGDLDKFNVVIANPPWNQSGYPEETLKTGDLWEKRFKYGFVTKNSADWAWVQHMIASADDENGRIGVVLDNGCLFRGGREKQIRIGILKDDLVECVINLPDKLFFNTSAPGTIIILNKNKPENRKDKVLFINANKEFIAHSKIRKLSQLSNENIKKIADTYKTLENIDGFAQIATINEIKENDYNLSVLLYAIPIINEEKIDVKAEWKDYKKLKERANGFDNEIEDIINELI